MGKRAERRLVRYEKDQSGCIWGFISMFDFRHGRSTQKLLPDRKRGNRHAVGTVYSKNKFEMLSNLDEAFQGILDASEGNASVVKGRVDKPSVKKLIEEEMFSEQHLKMVKNNTGTESKESSLGQSSSLKTNAKRPKGAQRKTRSMDSHDLNSDSSSEFSCNPHLRHSSMNDLDLNKLMEDFCHNNHLKRISSVKDDQGGELLSQANHKNAHIEDKVKKAIENFMSDTILNGKDSEAGKFSHIELIDALISSDKELLMKLGQDPDSFFRKDSQDLLGAQENNQASATAIHKSANGLDNAKETNRNVTVKQRRNIFRKIKTREKIRTDGSENAEASNRIVILKPLAKGLQNPKSESSISSSPISDDSGKSKGPSARSGSHFTLTEIKRKLKYAMGKERHLYSDGKDKEHCQKVNVGKDNVGRKSPSKDHFFLERMARPSTDNNRRETIGKLKEFKMEVEKGAEISSTSWSSSTFYAEAKKHLYEMLSNGDDGIEFLGQQVAKPLGRILSFSDYSSSPICSPRGDWEHGFVTSQLRVSPIENLWKTNDDICSPEQIPDNFVVDLPIQSIECETNLSKDSHESRIQPVDTNQNLSVNPVEKKELEDTSSVIEDEDIIGGKVEVQKEVDMLDTPSGTRSLSIEENNDNCVVSYNTEDQRRSESLNQDIFEDSQLSSPSRTLSTVKVEEVDCSNDVSGRPSPISVLEPPFTEDDVSPKYNKREAVEPPLQPLRIQFEECECSLEEQFKSGKLSIDQNKLILDYINTVIQASSLSWEKIWTKCLTCDHILDPCSFDQVVYFPNQLHLDQNILFDCINEVLVEVCCSNIGVSPWVWFVNPTSKPVTNLQRLVREVWEQLHWHLLPLPRPHTLDQIVRKDMERSGAWGDRRFDVEDVGVEMSDAILLELMDDSIFSCLSENVEIETPFELELMEVIAAPTCKELAALIDSCPDKKLVANPTEAVKASH